MKVVKGYRAIEIPVSSSLSSHSFFIKEHADSKSSSKSKTLFVGNVDYCGQRSNEDIDCYLRELFGTFGEIESISVSEFKSVERYDHQSRFAHITFKKSSHLKSVLSAADEAYLQCGIEVSRLWGLQDIFKKRSRQELYEALRSDEVDPVDLKSEVYEQMKDFEENEEIAKAERERKLNEVDDDGFRPVKHRKKKNRVEEKRGGGKHRVRAAKKNQELKNFYRFQMREERQSKLQVLRQKFEEDKARIATLKASRKFKPF